MRLSVSMVCCWLLLSALRTSGLAGQEICPVRANPTTENGWTALRESRLEEARGFFVQALAQCPDHLGAQTGLAYVDLREGRDEAARPRFEGILLRNPESVDALVGLGILAWRRGALEEVDRLFREVEVLDPGNETAASYLGRLRQEPGAPATQESTDQRRADEAWIRGDTETAVPIYEGILAADSTDGRALHRVALAYAWRDDYDRSLALFGRLLALEPGNMEAGVHRARVLAWQGNLDEALQAVEEVLQDHPDYLPALEAKAQFLSWAGDLSEAISSYDQLLGISEDPTGILLAQARILGGASRLEESRIAYDSVLARNPQNLEARLGQARLMALTYETYEAISHYLGIVRDHPLNIEARRGLAWALTFTGYLPEGEAAWRSAQGVSPQDLASILGLAQNLRWQGRNDAALEALGAATWPQREYPDYQEQLAWVRSDLNPRSSLSVIREGDSDNNAMTTVQLRGATNPYRGVAIHGEVYTRFLEQTELDLSSSSTGVNFRGSYQMEPGWVFNGGIGGTWTDGSGRNSFTSLSAGVTSPRRNWVGGSLILSRYPLDVTAQLVEQGVRVGMADLSGRWNPAPGWQVLGAAGIGSYEGEEENHRVHFNVRVDRSMRGGWTLGLSHKYFGFDKDLDEFYFDPDYFGLTEVAAGGLWERGGWGFLLEAAPGAQKVRSAGDYELAFRSSARLSYRVAPGRQVFLSGGFSSAGLQSFNTGESDYQYFGVILGGSWVF